MIVIIAEPLRIYQTLLRLKLKNTLSLIVSTPQQAKDAIDAAPKGSVFITALFFPGFVQTGWDLADYAKKRNMRSLCCTDRMLFDNEKEPFDEISRKLELGNVCEREISLIEQTQNKQPVHFH